MRISLFPVLSAIFLSLSQSSSAGFVLNVNPVSKEYYLSGEGAPIFLASFGAPITITWDNGQPRAPGGDAAQMYGNSGFSVPPENPVNVGGITMFIYGTGNVNAIFQAFGPVNATVTGNEVPNSYQSWIPAVATLLEQKAAAGEALPVTSGSSAFDITFRLVPEPSATGLLAASVIGLAAFRKRK